MSPLNRREFLQSLAAGSAIALSPLSLLAAEEAPRALAIARWQGEALGDATLPAAAGRLTECAISAIGGMGRFVAKGDRVWIKPNIGWNRSPAQAANTHPEVVAALVRLSLAAGAKSVRVGDHPCQEPRQTYATSGIAAAVAAAGGEMITLDPARCRRVALGGARLKEWEVFPEILEADLVINVPVVKHHGLSRATACLKNTMGVVGGNRSAWHQDLPSCLVDITAFMKPRLCVLDATRILLRHGPQGGNLEDVAIKGLVAAGADPVALDALGAELLGLVPAELATLKAAVAAGLGSLDYRAQAGAEIAVS
jgi:uncharacterized protein (DUF362 family)